MSKLEETNWILSTLSKKAETACTRSLKLLKAKNQSDFEEAVPKIRDNYKIIRAILRLVRDDFKDYKKENEFYRNEAKKILSVQQAIVMVKTIDIINEQYSERLYKNAFTELRDKLEEHKDKQIESALNEEHVFQDLHQNLSDKCGNLKEGLLKPVSKDTLASGLKKVYQRGRDAQNALSDSKSEKDFHELQKRANYLEIQLGMLSPIWPDMIGVWKSELEKLSHLLLTSEGLYQLSGFLRSNAGGNIKEDGVYLMNTLIEGHREQVQQHALLSAKKIYSLKPKHFMKYIDAAWETHESESAQKILPSDKLKLSK